MSFSSANSVGAAERPLVRDCFDILYSSEPRTKGKVEI